MGCQNSRLMENNKNQSGQLQDRKNLRKKRAGDIQINGRFSCQQVFENIVKQDYKKKSTDCEFIEKILSSHFLLYKLGKTQRKELSASMEFYTTTAGQYIFKQGDQASMFFIIKRGKIAIQVNGLSANFLQKGDSFGELALIYQAPRSASVKALEDCSFWCLNQSLFLKVQQAMIKNNYKIAKPLVSKLTFFNFLSNKQKDAIAYNMNTLKYEKNEIIFKEGDDATSFYILVDGQVQIDISGKPAIQLKQGDSFGQNCIKPNEVRRGTAKSIEKVNLLAISRDDLINCLGETGEELLFHNVIQWSLRRSNLFKNLNLLEQQKFISLGNITKYRDNEEIKNKKKSNENLYICLEGKMNNYEVGVILNETEIIQSTSISFSGKEAIIKKGEGHVFEVAIASLQELKIKQKLNKRVEIVQFLDIQEDKGQNQMIRSRKRSTFRIELNDYLFIKKIGEGQFGRVFLVENKKNSQKYAIKCVEKNMIITHEMQKFMVAQKQILSECEHSRIVKFIGSTKDSHFIYLVLSFIQGGDFFEVLRIIGKFNGSQAKFYFGCFVLAIQYLHKKSIVYRDLKPENAAIDTEGYLHMIDMGTAKKLTEEDESGFRTFTIIGTPHYMAPEVIEAKGYSFSVDVWSLGILLFEMVCNYLPFGNDCEDAIQVYQEIEKKDLKFPKNYHDAPGKQLIKRLLIRHPEKRRVDDYQEIKNMAYFNSFNWKDLENEKMDSPYKPNLENAMKSVNKQPLVNYLQKEKEKLKKPLTANDPKWDEYF